MKNILKLSLIISGLYVLCAFLSCIISVYWLPNHHDVDKIMSLNGSYGYTSIVCKLLSLVFFILLFRKAAANSPLNWPFAIIIGGLVLSLLSYVVLFYSSHISRQLLSKVSVPALLIPKIFLSVGLVWFGLYFEKRSMVRISTYLIPALYAIGLFTPILFGANPYEYMFCSNILGVLLETTYAIFFYSFYKYNQSYGRN